MKQIKFLINRKFLKRCFVICFCFILLKDQFVFNVIASDYYIAKYDITMDVKENGEIYIEEKIMPFLKKPKHGIYRTIPTKYRVTVENEGKSKKKEVHFPIEDIDCLSCEVSSGNSEIKIKLGNPNATVTGPQIYQLKYKVITTDLNLKDKQQLYWNIIGTGFNTTIKKASFKIIMPKSFDSSNVRFFTGAGKSSKGGNVSWNISNNVIQGQINNVLKSNEGLTVKIDLPKDYFSYPLFNKYFIGLLSLFGIVTIVVIFLYFKFGKKDPIFPIVEFHAPKGLDSAAVGFIIDGKADVKDILSLIIDWANCGYLKIHCEEKSISIEQIKDESDCDFKPYELEFYRGLFEKENFVNERQLKKRHISQAMERSLLKLYNYYSSDPTTSVFTKESCYLRMGLWGVLGIFTLLFSSFTMYVYNYLWKDLIYAILITIGVIFASILLTNLHIKRYVYSKKSYLIFSIIGWFVFCITHVFLLIILYSWKEMIGIFYGCCFSGISFLLLWILIHTEKRTKQGNLWINQILGLKEFILLCEKDRLEALAKDNPEAFYHVLPYASILGVSDVLMSKLEGVMLTQPDWLVGNGLANDFMFYNWWNHLDHRLNNAISTLDTSGVGNGSNVNISNSSGFSGGGFGGGGGGTW